MELSYNNTVVYMGGENRIIPPGTKKVIFYNYHGSFVAWHNGSLKSIISESVKKVVVQGTTKFPLFVDDIRILPDNIKSFKNLFIPKYMRPGIRNGILEKEKEHTIIINNGVRGFPYGIRTIHFENEDICLEYCGEKTIPDSVTKLKLPFNFNELLINRHWITLLPNSIKTLEFSGLYHHPLIIDRIRCLPDTLEKLVMPSNYDYPLMDGDISIFPPALREIDFSKCVLKYCDFVHTSKKSDDQIYLRVLPDNVKNITFPRNFDSPLLVHGTHVLPCGVETVSFAVSCYDQPIIINNIPCFPDGIKYIIFNFKFNQPIMNDGYSILPSNLRGVFFGQLFNQIIYDKNTHMSAFPSNMIDLSFGESFDYTKLYHNNMAVLPNHVKFISINTTAKVLQPKYFPYANNMGYINQTGVINIHKKIMLANVIYKLLPMPIADEIYEQYDIYSPFD